MMGRKTFTLTLDVEGAAFVEGFGEHEVAMILRSAATRVEAGALGGFHDNSLEAGQAFRLMDSNGNTVGAMRVEEVEA